MSLVRPWQDPGPPGAQDDPGSLARMHDLVLPDAPGGPWPIAPGWWILLAAASLLIVLMGVRAWLRWRADGYRRAALRELCEAPDAELPALLKRTALAAWPRGAVASLSGDEWLRFLDRTGGKPVFEGGLGRSLTDLTWRPDRPVDPSSRDALRDAVRDWIRQHRRDPLPVGDRC